MAGCVTRPLLVTTKDMAAATGNCPEANLLRKIVKSGFPTKIGDIDESMKEFWKFRKALRVDESGCILVNNRLLIPVSLREKVLNSLHAAYQGTTVMTMRTEKSV